MNPSLYARKLWLATCLLWGLALPARATHIVGGEVTYRYLGQNGPANAPYQYRLTFNVYVDRAPPSQFPSGVQNDISFGVYDAATNRLLLDQSILSNPRNVDPVLPIGCNIPGVTNVRVTLNVYEITVNLPFSAVGYHIVHQRCCRNIIQNVQNYQNTGNTFYAFIASPALTIGQPNSSPVFAELAIPYLCVRDTNTVVNNAVDPDGDRLEYSFIQPSVGGGSGNGTGANSPAPIPSEALPVYAPIPFITYPFGYSVAQPFGPGGYSVINARTGITQYAAPNLGRYTVMIQVREFRATSDTTEVLVGIIRRELQFVVGDCPTNLPPRFTAASLDTVVYTLEQSERVCVNVAATDDRNKVFVTASSELLDGSNGYAGPRATFVATSALRDGSGQFCWQTACDTRPGNYTLRIRAADDGCPPRDVTTVYTIQLLPFTLRPRIRGSNFVCPRARGIAYTVAGRPGYQYTWRVRGGSITAGLGTGTIEVDWGDSNADAEVSVQVRSAAGCTSEVVRLPVQVRKLLKPGTPEGKDTLCLSAAGNVPYQTIFANGSSYRWQVRGGRVVSGDGTPNVTVTWDTPGVGLLWVFENSTTQVEFCEGGSDTLRVIVAPTPDARRIQGNLLPCDQQTGLRYVLNGLPGSSYQWTLPAAAGTIRSGQRTNAIVVDWGRPGAYQLSARETSVFGCVGPPVDTTVVVGAIPVTTLASNNLNICPQNLLARPYAAVGLAGSRFAWTASGGTVASGQGTPQVTVDWDASGAYTLSVQETSAQGCPGLPVRLPLRYDPSALFIRSVSGQPTLARDREVSVRFGVRSLATYPTNLSISRRNRTQEGTWQVVAPSVAKADTIFTEGNLATSNTVYEYRLNGRNSCGFDIESAVHNSVLLLGEGNQPDKTVQLSWNPYLNWAGGVRQYEIWRQLDGADRFVRYDVVPGNVQQYTRKNGTDGFRHCYKVRAVEQGGNQAFSWSNALCVKFEHPLADYNVITPGNADGQNLNERWTFDNLNLYPDNELTVYNRWGKEVFRQVGYGNDWSGDNLPSGVYYYALTVRGFRYAIPPGDPNAPAEAFTQRIRGTLSILR